MRKGKGKGSINVGGPTGGQGVPDLDFAVNLHRVIAQQLPRRIEVDNIPAMYLQTFWKQFPIPPEVVPAGPGGLAGVLQREFGHLVTFSQNRQGVWCADLVFPPETPLEEIARFHIDFRSGIPPPSSAGVPIIQAAAQAIVPAKPQAPPTRTLSKEEEASAQLIVKGVHQVLVSNPALGEAESMNDMKRQIQQAFYYLFGVPMVLASGLPVDPIELIKKNQQKSFSRLLEDPMTGATSVKAIVENPQFSVIGTVTSLASKLSVPSAAAASLVGGPVASTEPLQAGMKQLRVLLAENLKLIDKALIGPVSVPDANLWKSALTALVQQETQTRDILINLFK